MPKSSRQLPKIYLLIDNPSRSNNLGPVLRCCSAFRVEEVIFVGYSTCSVDGSHGSHKAVNTTNYPTWDQAVSYVRDRLNVSSIVGVVGSIAFCEEGRLYDEKLVVWKHVLRGEETISMSDISTYDAFVSREDGNLLHDEVKTSGSKILAFSYPIHQRPFQDNQDICLIINKQMQRGHELFQRQLQYCDFLVHIPTTMMAFEIFGGDECANDNESELDTKEANDSTCINLNNYIGHQLDAQSCLSISLHHFTSWAQYNETDMQGQKYEVTYNHHHIGDMDIAKHIDSERNRIHMERKQRQEDLDEAASEALEDGDWSSLFS